MKNTPLIFTLHAFRTEKNVIKSGKFGEKMRFFDYINNVLQYSEKVIYKYSIW